ncbi:aldo/keto reductase [bacterium]|nr:aldo/keto reductase [bacterium]
MQYRKLGKWGIRVSTVSLGGWLTHGRSLEDDQTEAIVKGAFDLGINFFDTADVYNNGEAEISLAKAVKGLRRDDLVIGTKCFFPMTPGVNDRGLGRKHIFESVHHSLKRLRMDYVDLMQFHRFDPETPMEETVRAIDDLIRQGKVMYWGVSEWSSAQITRVCHVAKELNCCLPVSNQPRYNMLDRKIEARVIPASEQYGLGQVVFSPLAQGVLTGKYEPKKAPPAGSRGADESSNMFMANDLSEAVLAKVKALGPVAKEQGCTVGQLALAWCLRQSNVSSVIVGATSVKQLEENAGASDLEIPAEVFERCNEILA